MLAELNYWNPAVLEPPFAPLQKHRYLTFDTDLGGLSNIRLVFEYVAVVAAITGRTLVLPPSEPWYLINNGPKHAGKREGATHFGDIMDIPALQQILPVLTAEEFIQEASEHLSIPQEFQGEQSFQANGELWRRWKEWIVENTEVAYGWNPHETLICFPNEAGIDHDRLTDKYRDGRRFIEFTPRMNAAPVVHFPSTYKDRSLGPVATMLAPGNEEWPRLSRRLIKHHIRYHPQIFEIASELISLMGCYQYSALHIRRNDFQYKQTRANPDKSWENIERLLPDSKRLYIATDEVDEEFRAYFKDKKEVIFWGDLVAQYNGPEIPEKYIGCIEQLICVTAHRFIGTDLSTFSSYIVRLRGYTDAPDTASYYHTEQYAEPLSPPGVDDFHGRNYLRENPLFWLDA